MRFQHVFAYTTYKAEPFGGFSRGDEPIDPKEKSILVIDDSVINLKLLSVLLTKEGYTVYTAHDSLEAVPLAIQCNPDLILLDVMMPGINGLEILKLLKINSLTQNIPIVMVTARTKGEDVREALEAGAFDYIKKPLDEVEISARIRSALRYKAYQDRLIEMAMRDSLTGLYNHALITDLLEKELYNAGRKGIPVSFAMLDVDYFKKINDQFGHQAGDYVLQQLSRLLAQGLRKGDPIGRYGGEEFGIILTGVDLSVSQTLCERLRVSVMNELFTFANQRIPVTISLGLAIAKAESKLSPNELIKIADQALYQAKEAGRNRLVCAP